MEGTTWFTALTGISHMFTTVLFLWYGHPSRNSRVMSFSQCRRKWMTLPQCVYHGIYHPTFDCGWLSISKKNPHEYHHINHIPSKPLLLVVYNML